MKQAANETMFIDALVKNFAPPPHRRNATHESDAELIELPFPGSRGSSRVLAVTTDTVAEEISSGLYADLYQAGWIAAVASLSDLAAVGASALGIMVAETVPPDCPDAVLAKLQAGIGDACESAGTYVLGGDTNFGRSFSITTTAIGVIADGRVLTRRGARPGDVLFAGGRIGRGNGYALAVLGNGLAVSFAGGYFPRPQLREGSLIRGVATSCMDTSDGFFATLDQLGSINGVGFTLEECWEAALDPASLAAARRHGLPPWFLLAGPHGEFELLFTVGAHAVAPFRESARSIGWDPLEIGKVTGEPGTLVPLPDGRRLFDTVRIRNIAWDPESGIDGIIRELFEYERETGKGER